MIAKRLIALVAATTLTVGSVSWGWAADEPVAQQEPRKGGEFAAAMSNTIYVPGKAVLCATSGVLWTVAMVASFGTCYKECSNFTHDVCTGKWIVTPSDMTDP